MSELLKRVAADQLAARKSGDKIAASVLTTLLGEASKLTAEDHKKGVTEVTDGRVIATVKNFISNVEQTLSVARPEQQADLQREMEILSAYVPAQLTEDDLNRVIGAWKDEGKNLGQIMAQLKAEYEGRYDGKLASGIARG